MTAENIQKQITEYLEKSNFNASQASWQKTKDKYDLKLTEFLEFDAYKEICKEFLRDNIGQHKEAESFTNNLKERHGILVEIDEDKVDGGLTVPKETRDQLSQEIVKYTIDHGIDTHELHLKLHALDNRPTLTLSLQTNSLGDQAKRQTLIEKSVYTPPPITSQEILVTQENTAEAIAFFISEGRRKFRASPTLGAVKKGALAKTETKWNDVLSLAFKGDIPGIPEYTQPLTLARELVTHPNKLYHIDEPISLGLPHVFNSIAWSIRKGEDNRITAYGGEIKHGVIADHKILMPDQKTKIRLNWKDLNAMTVAGNVQGIPSATHIRTLYNYIKERLENQNFKCPSTEEIEAYHM